MKTIPLPRKHVRSILWLSQFFNDNDLQVICNGYNGDYENYTGLTWECDKDLNPNEKTIINDIPQFTYPEFYVEIDPTKIRLSDLLSFTSNQ